MPYMEKLTELVERCERVVLTVVDTGGHPHTCALAPLRVPFHGHLWFRVRSSSQAAVAIGRGSEASVACGDVAAGGPGATLYGSAVVLRDPGRASAAGVTATPQRDPATVLVCISTSAAELWNDAATPAPRVIAFPSAVPVGARVAQPPAFEPALVREQTISCAS